MWIALQFVNTIAKVNLEGRITHTYRIPVPAQPHVVAIADDGAAWWTGKYGGNVGRLDPRTLRFLRATAPARLSLLDVQGDRGPSRVCRHDRTRLPCRRPLRPRQDQWASGL